MSGITRYGMPARLAERIDGDNVGMVEPSDSLRLEPEADTVVFLARKPAPT